MNLEAEAAGLDARARKFLAAHGVSSKEDLKRRWEAGELPVEKLYGVGPKTVAILRAWCGAVKPPRPARPKMSDEERRARSREHYRRRVAERPGEGYDGPRASEEDGGLEAYERRLQAEIDEHYRRVHGKRPEGVRKIN